MIPQLPLCTEPTIQVRTFASGLSVLHTPLYSHSAFAARLSGMLALAGPHSAMQIAQEEGITLGLSTELVAAVEADGYICRDDETAAITEGASGGAEVKWWANLLIGYVWDGHLG